MTCIVGMTDGHNVWIAGDSASADGWFVRQSLMPKVFAAGEVLIGYSSSWRMGQILQAHLEIPDTPKRDSLLKETVYLYVIEHLVDSIRSILHRYHWATEKHNKQEGCALLIGYRGHLFLIGDNYSVTESADGYEAIGCGSEFALGALYASATMPPRERINLALQAATHMSGGVMAPFYLMCLRDDGSIGALP